MLYGLVDPNKAHCQKKQKKKNIKDYESIRENSTHTEICTHTLSRECCMNSLMRHRVTTAIEE